MSTFEKDVKVSLKQVVDFLPAHVYWLNKDMAVLGCNIRQAKAVGFSSPQKIVGKTLYDFLTKEIADAHFQNNQLVLKNKKTMTFEEVAFLSDGTKHVFLSEKSPLFDQDGNVIGLLG